MVYVLSKEGSPLMPCSNVIGRLLLKEKKAKVKMTTPFVIQLNYETTEYKQDLTFAEDSGSSKIGSAAINEVKKEVVYISEIEIRNDISKKMKRRSEHKNKRRYKNTRYRKPRFLNRKNSIKTNRFSPTMTSKIDSHLKEEKFVKSILPITKTIIETGTFDAHALKNPNVLQDKSLYQQGINYGHANTRAYVLHRDNHTCQRKGCTTKNKTLHVHHITFKKNWGSDDHENLITLCDDCHDGVHDGTIDLKLKGKKKGDLNHASQMNSIRVQLLKILPEAKETFGYITKEHRKLMNLPKTHYFDAVAIASQGHRVIFKTDAILFKKCVADGDYQMKKGVRSEIDIPLRKIMGFRKFDKVEYKNNHYFIKGRSSTGYAFLMDIAGKHIKFSPMPKLSKLKRISARKSWIMMGEKIIE